MRYVLAMDYRKTFSYNPSLKLIEQFNRLTNREMAFVMLVADLNSPMRHLYWKKGELECRKRSVRWLWDQVASRGLIKKNGELSVKAKAMVYGRNERVEDAIKFYRDLQGADMFAYLELMEGKIQAFLESDAEKNGRPSELYMRVLVNIIDKKILTKLAKERMELEQLNAEHTKKMADINDLRVGEVDATTEEGVDEEDVPDKDSMPDPEEDVDINWDADEV